MEIREVNGQHVFDICKPITKKAVVKLAEGLEQLKKDFSPGNIEFDEMISKEKNKTIVKHGDLLFEDIDHEYNSTK